jgi:tape measure domain-containing protein
VDDIGYATLPVIPSVRGARRSIERQLNDEVGGAGRSAGRSAGEGFNRGFTGVLARLGTVIAAVGIGKAVGSLFSTGIKGAATLETQTTAFTSLLGSAAAAKAEIADLQKFAAATPFQQQDVIGYAQQYLALAQSVGLAKDQTIPFLTVVGNLGAVTGATQQDIANAIRAIAQMGSSGKVTLDNLNQVSEAFPGFNGAAAIAAATGQSTADVMKEISAGSISASVGVQALLKGMEKFPGAAGAMTAQSKTLAGIWSTFTDTIKIKLTSAFQQTVPTIKKALSQLTPAIGAALDQMAPAIAGLVKNLVPLLIPLTQGIGQILTSVFAAIGPALGALAPVVQPLANAFAQLVRRRSRRC